MSNKFTIKDKFPIKEMLDRLECGEIKSFTYYVEDTRKNAEYLRNSITNYALRREIPLYVKPTIFEAIVDDQIKRFILVELQ